MENKKKRIVPNNKTTYTVVGIDNELKIEASNEQSLSIPPMPKEIDVDPHGFEILPNGEIIRKGKDGRELGTVKDPKAAKTIKGELEGPEEEAGK